MNSPLLYGNTPTIIRYHMHYNLLHIRYMVAYFDTSRVLPKVGPSGAILYCLIVSGWRLNLFNVLI